MEPDLLRLRWWVQCSLPWTRLGICGGVTVRVTVTAWDRVPLVALTVMV